DAVALLTATAFPYVCSWSARQKLGDSRPKGGQAVRCPRPAVQYHLVIFGTDATIWPSLLGCTDENVDAIAILPKLKRLPRFGVAPLGHSWSLACSLVDEFPASGVNQDVVDQVFWQFSAQSLDYGFAAVSLPSLESDHDALFVSAVPKNIANPFV